MHIFSIPYSSCLCLLENRLWLLAYFTYRPDVPSIATPHPAACRTRWALSETECPAGRNMLFFNQVSKGVYVSVFASFLIDLIEALLSKSYLVCGALLVAMPSLLVAI